VEHSGGAGGATRWWGVAVSPSSDIKLEVEGAVRGGGSGGHL
jgi:hypothetical protein